MKNLLLWTVIALFACLSVNAQVATDTVPSFDTIVYKTEKDGKIIQVRRFVRLDAEGMPMASSPDSFFVRVPMAFDVASECGFALVPKVYDKDKVDTLLDRKRFLGRLLGADYDTTLVFPPPINPASVDVDTLFFAGSGYKNVVIFSEAYTAGEIGDFRQDCDTMFVRFKADWFWKDYWSFFNWYRVFNASPTSQVRHDSTAADEYTASPPVPKTIPGNTPFDARFDYGGTHRLLYCPNTQKLDSLWIYAALQNSSITKVNSPAKMILINTPYYGGSGGTYAASSVHVNASQIMIHELAHSFAFLADEYGGSSCTGFTSRPNASNQTSAALVPWNVIATTTVFPTPNFTNCTGIGYYCGSNYCNACPNVSGTGWLRPACDCKMRTLGVKFCKACLSSHRNKVYAQYPTTLLASNTSTADTIYFPDVPTWTLKFPLTNKMHVQRYVAGVPVAAFDATTLLSGSYNISIVVTDSAYYGVYLDNDPVTTVTWKYKNGGTPATPIDSATFVSQSVPDTMTVGVASNVTMTWTNNGTTTWSAANGYSVRSKNPDGNSTWTIVSEPVDATVLPPNNLVQTMSVTPTSAGTKNFQWGLYNGNYFDQYSTNKSVVVLPAYNATFVSQSVPTTVTSGQTYSVTVTMNNPTGSAAWAATDSLGAVNPNGNSTWGLTGISSGVVAAGSNKSFVFTITAPTVLTTTTYNFQWRMKHAGVYFGSSSQNLVITVNPLPVYNSTFGTQTTFTSGTAGSTKAITMTFTNTGNQVWNAGSTIVLRSRNADGNTTWGFATVNMPSTVAVGGVATFNFTVTLPAAGTYNFQWALYRNGGYFGANSTNQVVTVSAAGVDNAGNVLYTVPLPLTMTSGSQKTLTIKFKNTGTTTWTSGAGYRLAHGNPANATYWSVTTVPVSGTIAPGDTATFSFAITAPTVVSTTNYNAMWRLQKNTTFFGGYTPLKVISVSPSSTYNSSQFNSQTTVMPIYTGQTKSVSLTFFNNGTTTWDNTYSLVPVNGLNTWGTTSVVLSGTTAPQNSKTITFNITAPATQGTYNYQWVLQKTGVANFGQVSTNQSVTVTAAPTGSCVPVLNTAQGGGDGLLEVVGGVKVWLVPNPLGTQYKYEKKLESSSTWVTVVTTTLNPKTITGLLSGQAYRLRITFTDPDCTGQPNQLITPVFTPL